MDGDMLQPELLSNVNFEISRESHFSKYFDEDPSDMDQYGSSVQNISEYPLMLENHSTEPGVISTTEIHPSASSGFTYTTSNSYHDMEDNNNISSLSTINSLQDQLSEYIDFTKPSSEPKKVEIEKPKKTFACETCGRVLTTGWKLKSHMRTHTGERPHSCTICNKSFTEKCSLKRHFRTHTGEKLFKCNYCDRKFTQAYSMKVHQSRCKFKSPEEDGTDSRD